MDDHVRKLFWAIWGPSMGSELITADQITSNIGLAQKLHDRRVQALYVDSTDAGVSLPTGIIAADEARSLIRMVEARLEMEKADDHPSEAPAGVAERSEWFFQATEDADRRQQIMGAKSMQKLKELGNVPAWVAWLKDTFEKHDAEMRELIEREMQRKPDDPATARNKWMTTVRLYTDSHSIRQRPLNLWNDGINWIKLRAVSNQKDQLLVDFYSPSDMVIDNLWAGGYHMSRIFVVALNVGTIGYFWFHLPLDDANWSGRYYERIVDLDTKAEVRAKRTPALRLEFGRKDVHSDALLRNVLLCFAILVRMRSERERDMCARYLEGLAHIGKTDVHMAFQPQGVLSFYLSLRDAMLAYGDWKDTEPFPPALRRFVADALPRFDAADLEKLIEVGEAMTCGRGIPHALTMNDVGLIKITCDVYLLRTFRRIEPDRLTNSAPPST